MSLARPILPPIRPARPHPSSASAPLSPSLLSDRYTVAGIFSRAERVFEQRVDVLLRVKRDKAIQTGAPFNARKAKRDARTVAGREKLDALVRRLADVAAAQHAVLRVPQRAAVAGALDGAAAAAFVLAASAAAAVAAASTSDAAVSCISADGGGSVHNPNHNPLPQQPVQVCAIGTAVPVTASCVQDVAVVSDATDRTTSSVPTTAAATAATDAEPLSRLLTASGNPLTVTSIRKKSNDNKSHRTNASACGSSDVAVARDARGVVSNAPSLLLGGAPSAHGTAEAAGAVVDSLDTSSCSDDGVQSHGGLALGASKSAGTLTLRPTGRSASRCSSSSSTNIGKAVPPHAGGFGNANNMGANASINASANGIALSYAHQNAIGHGFSHLELHASSAGAVNGNGGGSFPPGQAGARTEHGGLFDATQSVVDFVLQEGGIEHEHHAWVNDGGSLSMTSLSTSTSTLTASSSSGNVSSAAAVAVAASASAAAASAAEEAAAASQRRDFRSFASGLASGGRHKDGNWNGSVTRRERERERDRERGWSRWRGPGRAFGRSGGGGSSGGLRQWSPCGGGGAGRQNVEGLGGGGSGGGGSGGGGNGGGGNWSQQGRGEEMWYHT